MGDIIDDIIKREGGETVTNDPTDKGGRTQYGISERSHPDAWRDGRITYEEARNIYRRKYLDPFKGFEKYDFYEQAVDFGVTSGPRLVIQKIQELVRAEVDGVIGPETLGKVSPLHDLINNWLVAERIKMIGRIVSKNPSQLKYINGWLDRSLEFLR